MNAWKCEETYHGWIVYEVDDSGEPVAGPVIADCGDNEAVARRIAKLPELEAIGDDLLEALKSMIHRFGHLAIDSGKREAAEAGLAAIAKADGKGTGS